MIPPKKKRRGGGEPMEVDGEEVGEASNQNDSSGEIDQIIEEAEGGIRIGDIYIPPAAAPALTFDSTGPRLIITHIVNENFKSYYGTQILGPFHKSFTAIIGPNGSGKSNVIDSMLFVFGYRATKIRSKKISVLIHDSTSHSNVNSATVAVHFSRIIDGVGNDFMTVPNSEMVITRTAFKDNSSYYTLNGRRVQFKEVAKVLRSQGIDLDHNRFLILQGEVEQIALMKPKATNEHESGMLEYLEDIIGTVRYKESINKLMNKVEEYSEMRKEKLNRVRLVEAEKEKLEAPMKEAVQLVNLTNIVLRTRNMLLQKYIHETEKIIDGKKQEMLVLEETVEKIDEKLNSIVDQMNEKEAILAAGTTKYNNLKKLRNQTSDKLAELKKNIAAAQSELNLSNKRKKNLDQLVAKHKETIMELDIIPEKNKRELEDCEKLLAKHKENKRVLSTELQAATESVRAKTANLQNQKDNLKDKQRNYTRIVAEASEEFKVAESDFNTYMSSETNEMEKLESLKKLYEKAVADTEEKRKLIKEYSKDLPGNEQKLKAMLAKLEKINVEESKARKEIQPLREKVVESRRVLIENRTRNRVLDALMTEKKSGRITGIYGRLGDLGGIDQEYDVAISTSCSGLDNIVVTTMDTGQVCLEFLKDNEIGRATFVALDRQQHFRAYYDKVFPYPENVLRLFDLVRVKDDRMRPAFYHALRDTLLANDLDQASRIAYGRPRYRVVTMIGDVIELAGTMSGGGKTTIRGRIGVSAKHDTRDEEDPKVVEANEARLAELENILQALNNERIELENSSTCLRVNIREARTALASLNIELRNLEVEVPVLQKSVNEQETKTKQSVIDPVRTAELQSALESARGKLEATQQTASEIENEIKQVDIQMSAVIGKKVKEIHKKDEELASKIEKVYSEIKKLQAVNKNSTEKSDKLKEELIRMQKDLTGTEEEIETLNNKKKKLTLISQQHEKEIEDIDEQISEGKQEFSGLKEDLTELKTEYSKIKTERIAATDSVDKMEAMIKDCKNKIPMWERELKSLKLEDPGVEGIPGIEPLEPMVRHTPEELEDLAVEELRNRLVAQKTRTGDARPNIQVILDYKAREELYLKRAAELDEITQRRNEMREVYDQLKKRRHDEFCAGFVIITTKLKEMYQMITLGGDAELELVDVMDPFLEGVIFSVRPPNKSWKNISNLSGGEKTLSSLALVFALHYYKPSPLYVMDEIDAALDFKNVSIVANYIKERTRNAQFIIISLRYNMFEVSNRLVGIYKTGDCTKSVTIENEPPEANEDILEEDIHIME